ncbi:MAG: thiamine diphosphokinase [Candidatus Cloacimonas sp.]|nr:thiamine diphosphokinase [Candidatus Cloacimonadota bacterium]
MSKKGIIFCVHSAEGKGSAYKSLLSTLGEEHTLIAVDSGADILFEQQIIPDVIIGDLDSIQQESLNFFKNKVEIVRYPKEKDETDTELAVGWCEQQGIKEIIIINSLRGDLAHTLGVMMILKSASRRGLNIKIESLDETVFEIPFNWKGRGVIGQKFSLIALTPEVEGITTTGLAYPLINESIFDDSCRGLSNLLVDEEVTINYRSGKLIGLLDKINGVKNERRDQI